MKFYIYRKGYNTANQPLASGGPETQKVAEVEANSKDEAEKLALERVTVYNNQTLWAEPAEEVDARELEIDERVNLL